MPIGGIGLRGAFPFDPSLKNRLAAKARQLGERKHTNMTMQSKASNAITQAVRTSLESPQEGVPPLRENAKNGTVLQDYSAARDSQGNILNNEDGTVQLSDQKKVIQFNDKRILISPHDSNIGTGSYGIVLKVQIMEPNGTTSDAVLKKLSKRGGGDEEFNREINNLSKVSEQEGPFLELYGSWSDDDSNYILTSYANSKNLSSFISTLNSSGDPLASNPDILRFAEDIAQALDTLHTQAGLLHRDINANNIFLHKKGDEAPLEIMIGDMGSATPINSSEPAPTAASSPISPGYHKPISGTPDFAAPELFGKNPTHTPASEVFSFGSTLLQMVTGKNIGQFIRSDQASSLIKREVSASEEEAQETDQDPQATQNSPNSPINIPDPEGSFNTNRTSIASPHSPTASQLPPINFENEQATMRYYRRSGDNESPFDRDYKSSVSSSSISTQPSNLIDLALKCCSPNPAERPSSMLAVVKMIKEIRAQ